MTWAFIAIPLLLAAILIVGAVALWTICFRLRAIVVFLHRADLRDIERAAREEDAEGDRRLSTIRDLDNLSERWREVR